VSRLEQLWAGWRSAYVGEASGAGGSGGSPGPDGSGPGRPSDPGGSSSCVFCRILRSDEPDGDTHVLWRHERASAVAILNAYPYTCGHLMVMPARHVSRLEMLDPTESAAVWEGVGLAVRAIEAAYRPDGLNLGANLGRAAGAGIPDHLHVHVLPRWVGDTNFTTAIADLRVLPETLGDSADKLRRAWPQA
jgi:ATP adenylyltransferase